MGLKQPTTAEMHKLSADDEGPIDNIFAWLVERAAPIFKATGHTPNIITTYSLALGLFAAYNLFRGNMVVFAMASVISYFMDCADGYVARKYKMTSKFGDVYDHGSDTIINIATAAAFYMRYAGRIVWRPLTIAVTVAFAVIVALMLTHLGCQQWIHNPDNRKVEESLDILRVACPRADMIGWTRYFSCGTAKMALVAVVLYFEKFGTR